MGTWPWGDAAASSCVEKKTLAEGPFALAQQQSQATEQVRELMSDYGPIDMMWWDGNAIMSPEELAQLQPDIFVARGLIATPEGMHYPEFHQPLGKYTRVSPGQWQFTREFEHASVWVDTEKREAKIDWK